MFVWLSVLPVVFIIYGIQQKPFWSGLVIGILLITVAFALYGISQYLFFHATPQAFFRTPNTYAGILNLAALPASAYFLYVHGLHRTKLASVLAICLFILFYAIAQTGGRGAMLGLILGLGFVLLACRKHCAKRALFMLIGVWLGATLLANMQGNNIVTTRLGTLAQPQQAAFTRLVIWEPAWHMALAQPWIGSGVGTYYLRAAAHRDPEDSSGGFFVHNDYLQIWLETGLVGLLLLATIMLSAAFMLLRLLHRAPLTSFHRFEAIGLGAGLLAIASHSVVDFHFYIVAILLVIALWLARLQEIYALYYPSSRCTCALKKFISRNTYRLIVFAPVLFVFFYLLPVTIAEHLRIHALRQSIDGKIQQAEANLLWASKLNPNDSKILNDTAELYRHALTLIKDTAPNAERLALLEKALGTLDHAQKLNPLRGITAEIRGHLYAENQDLDIDWHQRAIASYRHALSLEPRLYQARVAYAQLLLQEGKTAEAIALINEGVRYWYGRKPRIRQFYDFALQLNRHAGNTGQVNAILRRMETTGVI